MHIGLKIFIWGVLGLVVFGALLFGPAGTFDYWQAWVFLAAFVSTTIGPTIYLARNDPAALQRRMRSGPLAEGRTIQKFIVIGAFLGFFAMMVLSACDHRYGWSSVPAAVCVIGDVLVMTGLGIAMLVSSRTGMPPRRSGWRRARYWPPTVSTKLSDTRCTPGTWS